MNFLCSFSLPRSRDTAKGAAPQKREHPLSLSLFAQYTKLHDVLDTKLASCLAKKAKTSPNLTLEPMRHLPQCYILSFQALVTFSPDSSFPLSSAKSWRERRGER